MSLFTFLIIFRNSFAPNDYSTFIQDFQSKNGGQTKLIKQNLISFIYMLIQFFCLINIISSTLRSINKHISCKKNKEEYFLTNIRDYKYSIFINTSVFLSYYFLFYKNYYISLLDNIYDIILRVFDFLINTLK